MVQLGLTDNFKCQVLQWGGATVTMKEPSGLLVKPYLNTYKMREVVMQTAEPDSAREATERLGRILDSNYAKADLKQVADNATHMNAE